MALGFPIREPRNSVTTDPKFYMQNFEAMALGFSCIGTLCWMYAFGGCIASLPSGSMLEEVHEMTARIEKLSRGEHGFD